MLNFLKNLFNKLINSRKREFSPEEFELDYDLKTKGLEYVLGEMHNLIGHAIISFEVGGAVDMYYFLKHIKGTGFATMELLDPAGQGPLPNEFGTYELVAFTKYEYGNRDDPNTPFNLIERKICGIFTAIGNYSQEAVITPNDTCELPNDNEENTCLIFDLYEPDEKKFMIGKRKHHLLLCLQIFRSEMGYARENGAVSLFEKLKSSGHYPYSDLDREPVV
jgi:hypothetical protein